MEGHLNPTFLTNTPSPLLLANIPHNLIEILLYLQKIYKIKPETPNRVIYFGRLKPKVDALSVLKNLWYCVCCIPPSSWFNPPSTWCALINF